MKSLDPCGRSSPFAYANEGNFTFTRAAVISKIVDAKWKLRRAPGERTASSAIRCIYNLSVTIFTLCEEITRTRFQIMSFLLAGLYKVQLIQKEGTSPRQMHPLYH